MTELEQEIFAAQRRLLILWVDWAENKEIDFKELIEETKFITNYNDKSIKEDF